MEPRQPKYTYNEERPMTRGNQSHASGTAGGGTRGGRRKRLPQKNPSGVLEALAFSGKNSLNAIENFPQGGGQKQNLNSERDGNMKQHKNFNVDEYGISNTKILSPAQVIFVPGYGQNNMKAPEESGLGATSP